MEPHPVRVVVDDDLRRSRLTVFFRLLLAIPHLVWIFLWSITVLLAAVVQWVVTLATGRPAVGVHGFLCRYIRYSAHLNAYLWLVANDYPRFLGDPGDYPVDVVLPEPAPQERWRTLLRILLAIPSVLLASALGGSVRVYGGRSGRGGASYGSGGGGALALAVAFLGWFASLATGRMPHGLRDAGAYAIGYEAQTAAYVLLVTDRYPTADPLELLQGVPAPRTHPVRLVGDAHALRRSRLTVFFRLPLAIPHLVWLALWTVAALVLGIVNWFATLAAGQPPHVFHRFFTAYVRYALHVSAFLYLAANPFPGFVGAPGAYPLDLELPAAPQRQNRWKTAFRIVLSVPAWVVSSALGWALLLCAVYTWFVALVRGEAPWGLRNLSAYALRYGAQANAYLYLVTDAYPNASPLEGEDVPEQLELAPAP